jgi:hypothetical protein
MTRRTFFQAALVMALLLLLAASLSQAQGSDTATPQPQVPEAATGTAFTYQGQLVYDDAPVNDSCDFTFSLWDGAGSGEPPTGGTQEGSDVVVTGVPVGDGLFTVSLDFGPGAFTGEARWLQTYVACGIISDTLSPRHPLTPVPYALALPGLWTQQHALSPNVIGGHSDNSVTAGTYGATIGGGGADGFHHRVTDAYGTVGGGRNNQAGDDAGTASDATYATVAGGKNNTAGNEYATMACGWPIARTRPAASPPTAWWTATEQLGSSLPSPWVLTGWH